MRSRKLFMSVLGAMLFSHLTAQKFSAGQIITNEGDTVKCMIKTGKWDLNPNKVVTQINDDTKRYWPTEIAAFEVDNRTYVSARVRLDVSNHIDGTLDLSDSRPKFENDSIFAELIVVGKKNLYRYKSPSYKEHFLIGQQGAQLESLVFKRFLVWAETAGGQTYKRVVYNEEYKNQLEKNFADCPGFKDKIALTGYDLGQLASLFRLYYSCSN